MAFEEEINYTNSMYEQQGKAIINKRPTPVKILKKKLGQVTGFIEKKSTVDYYGTFKSRSIVFEAKSTGELRRFSLNNIHQHQVDHLEKCDKHGAISFMLIKFEKNQSVYLLPSLTVKSFWDRHQKGVRGTASILLEELDIHAYPVSVGRVPVDYLSVVQEVWGIT
jgi:recombination protein U